MGNSLSGYVLVAQSKCDVESIPITIMCHQTSSTYKLQAGNNTYGLRYMGMQSYKTPEKSKAIDLITREIQNNNYTAKFVGGNLLITSDAFNITLLGINKAEMQDPTYNSTILTCYRTQNK